MSEYNDPEWTAADAAEEEAMKRLCLYRCPTCGKEETILMSDTDRIVTCGDCTDDEGWRTVMVLMEIKGEE